MSPNTCYPCLRSEQRRAPCSNPTTVNQQRLFRSAPCLDPARVVR